MKHFSGLCFDENHRTLWRGSREVRLTRKAGAVLRCLIDAAGRTVSRDAILSTVWPGTHVHADNVKVLVHEIRTALEDDARNPQFVRSDPGGGYTFIAAIQDGAPPAMPGRVTAPPIAADGALLLKLAEAVADSSQAECRVFLVDGERGIGKSALCAELMRRAREIASARVCYGQAVPHAGSGPTYAPFVEALHHLARQAPRTVPALLARHAPTWLVRLPAWVSDIAPGPDVDLVPDTFRMIHEFVDLLEGLAAEGPTVIAVDDLQWADLETVELLRALARRHAPLRTVVLATYTPFAMTLASAGLRNLSTELRATAPSSSMTIESLTEEQVRDYLVGRFAADSAAALARVVHRVSCGNPMVMVSMVDTLVTTGSIGCETGGWRLRHPARTIERSLPPAVLETLRWRFDQLDPEDRVVLECAAVVGAEFCAADVARAAGAESPVSILRRLERLSDRGFIARRSRRARSFPSDGDVYRFIHPLHAQVVSAHAPVFEQLRAAERLALDRVRNERFG